MQQPTVAVENKVSTHTYISLSIVGFHYKRKEMYTCITSISKPSSKKKIRQKRSNRSEKIKKKKLARIVRIIIILTLLLFSFPFILKGMEYYQMWYVAPLVFRLGVRLTKEDLRLLLEVVLSVLVGLIK